ncbi:MAG: NAD-dependent epimerase/dehydratase family protein, partial [SAR202 cluster bacterium]|nr:NAD-dependent epimerase/dehydratase family protein [SAR202 cluster bacterium]
MTKSLVTGATGFIGANLVRRLLRDGHEVYALTRESSDWTRLKTVRDQIGTVQCLVTDTKAVAETIRKVKPDLV